MSAEKDFDVHLGLERYLRRIGNRFAVDLRLGLGEVDVRKPPSKEASQVQIVSLREVSVEDTGLIVSVDRLEALARNTFHGHLVESESGRHHDELTVLHVVDRQVGVSV